MSDCFSQEKWKLHGFRAIFFWFFLCNNCSFGQIKLEELPFGSQSHDLVKSWPSIQFDSFKKTQGKSKDNAELIQSIQELHPEGVTIQFSEKTYNFSQPILLNSNVLLQGIPDKTLFHFTLEQTNHLIVIKGGYITKNLQVQNLTKNKVQFHLKDRIKSRLDSNFCWIYLRPEDKEFVFSDWANGCSGQLLQGHYNDGQFFSRKPIMNRLLKSTMTVELLAMKKNVGIADIEIINNSPAASPQERYSNILFQLAQNCWISNVQSRNCNYAHVQIDKSSHCSVYQLSAKNAFNHGAGGVGYGVVLQYAASENLIESCAFDSLRHSMLLQIGAKFNKLTKNTSTNPYWTGNFYRRNRASDITFHGNYPEANLISNNVVNTIAFDRSHGQNGPNNVIVNNTTTAYGIVMSRKSAEDGQVITSNTICKRGKLKVRGQHRISNNSRIKCTN